MNNKAQGLPINFIVLAALAILILILAAGFVVAGGSSIGGAMGPQNAKNTCLGWCNQAQQTAATTDYSVTWGKTDKFCTRNQTIQGQGNKTCPQLGLFCSVTFEDGSTAQLPC